MELLDIDVWAPLRDWLRSRPYAILCGSGISRRSGLPTGRDFNETFVKSVVPPAWHSAVWGHLSEDSPVMLRFEGILDIWRKICDPRLEVLNTYRSGTPTSEHRALAHVAQSHPVITTNFDGLIERANCGALNVVYTESGFENAPWHAPGLYKIHGTLQRFTGEQPEELRADEEGFPIVTLHAISSNMESVSRRRYLHRVRKETPLVVVGYSGSDDFDVCRWLFEPGPSRESVWIVYHGATVEPLVLSAAEARRAGHAPRPFRVEPRADNWKIVLTSNPAELLADLSGQPFEPAESATLGLGWGSPSQWQQSVVTALLLHQVSRLVDAESVLRTLMDSGLSPTERLLTGMYLALALIPTGHPGKRREAVRYAVKAAKSLALDGPDRRRARLLATQAEFFTHRLGTDRLGAALTALYSEAETAGDEELCFDVAIFARQVARTHEGMKVAFEAARDRGSLPAKGIDLHESARAGWAACSSADALKRTIQRMEEAIAFRREVGHVEGLCASLNVCGVMNQRLAEWTAVRRPDYTLAMQRHEESRRWAEEGGFVWHRGQALIALAFIAAKNEDRWQIEARMAPLEELGDVLDPSDKHYLGFLTTLRRVLDSDLEGAASACTEIARVQSDKLGARMREAARFDFLLCRTWVEGGTSASWPELPPMYANVPFWQARVRQLKALPRAAWLLIDPFPP